MSEADARPHANRTTPTWEVELLISGVAVFAMLQLPGLLDDCMLALEPRVGAEWRQALILSYIYAKSAAVVMAATFVLHLLMRALWIALVGVDSVYPQGVRTDRMNMGPIQSGLMQGQDLSMKAAIERADNRASVVFALGVLVALMFAGICAIFPGTVVLIILANLAMGWSLDPLLVFMALFGFVLVPFVIAVSVDRSIGKRLRPGTTAYRLTQGALQLFTRMGMGPSNNLMMSVLASNGGMKRMQAVIFGIMMLAILGVGASYVAIRKPELFGSYGLFPRSTALQLDSAHYEDLRDPLQDGVFPYVQSRVIRGPYLVLTVPYDTLRSEPAMRRCTAPGKEHKEQRAEALLGCLAKLHAVSLDGLALADLHYEIASDSRGDRPALLAMIDIRTLAPGRHELQVARPARMDKKPDKDEPDPGFYRIPFWR